MNLKTKKNNFIATDRSISAYLKEINKYKVLSAAEEADLVEKMRNGDGSDYSFSIFQRDRLFKKKRP